MIQGICFDLFNTLINVADVPDHVGRFTADILGVSREEWSRACFGPAHEICKPSTHHENMLAIVADLKANITQDLIEQAVNERQRRFDFALKQVDSEVLAGLHALRVAGYKLALVSNASTSEIRSWSLSPLATLFDCVVFSCECGSKKPEPAIYQQALNALGLESPQCIFVGDGGSDEHRGAHAVGLKPVLMTRHLGTSTQHKARELYRECLYSEVRSVPELVERLARGGL